LLITDWDALCLSPTAFKYLKKLLTVLEGNPFENSYLRLLFAAAYLKADVISFGCFLLVPA